VVEELPERRERAERELACKTYATVEELIASEKELDLVINASYSHHHIPLTIKLLENDYNVLCEKPFGNTVAGVDAAVAAAEKNGKMLFVFQQSRFAPYFRKVREVVNSGKLGRILQINIEFNSFGRRWDWQTIHEYCAGNLLNTGPHPMDQAVQFFGEGMPEVKCIMDNANAFGGAEDYVKILLTGEGKPVIDLEISSCCAYPECTYKVYGTRGGLKGSMTHIEWKYFLESEAPEQNLSRAPISKPDGTPAYCGEQLPWHEESWDVPEEESNLFNTIAGRYYNNLYEAIVNGADFEIKLDEVRRQIAIIEECHRQNEKLFK
ncbi:MAG: Gfo/Idh/MocA family oxidoreductase, partial [Clostridiales bacterium]|nr:Gfo/Idh/MocA family oxidoreductase [Clostridiales bacterium]